MTGTSYEVVLIKLRREADGLFTATSPDLAGVCIVHRDRDRIIDDMPNVVRLWFKRNKGIDVEPFWGPRQGTDDTSAFPMAMIPAEVAAQAMAR